MKSKDEAKSIDEILDMYVSSYNLDVLGFRESGQHKVKEAIKALLLGALPEKKSIEIEIPDTLHRNVGFNQAIDQMTANINKLFEEE